MIYSSSPNLYMEKVENNIITDISFNNINYYDKTKDDNTTYFITSHRDGEGGHLGQIEDIVIHMRYNTEPKSRFGHTRRGTYSFKSGLPTIYEAIPISEGGKKRKNYKSKKNSRHRIKKTRRRH